jgi:hypothetical protein
MAAKASSAAVVASSADAWLAEDAWTAVESPLREAAFPPAHPRRAKVKRKANM